MPTAQTKTGAAPRTQAERSARSDRAMLEAAVELLLEHGPEKTTLAAIGEKAGYSRGLATYRFGTKARLFDEVCKSIGRRWLKYLQAGVGNKTGIDAMLAALNAFFRFLSESPREARVLHILYCGAASPNSEYQETSRSMHQRQVNDVANWVRAGITDGSIRKDADAVNVATQYVAYTTGITYLWMINPEAIDFDKASDSMKKQLTRSLSSK